MNRYLDSDPTEIEQPGPFVKCGAGLRRIWTVAGWSTWFHETLKQAWLCEPSTRYGVRGERQERLAREALAAEPVAPAPAPTLSALVLGWFRWWR